MRVRSAVPSYWRANALANFDGQSWWSDAPDVSAGRSPSRARAATSTRSRPATSSRRAESSRSRSRSSRPTPTTSSSGAGRRRCRSPSPIDLRVGDARDLAVDPPLGPKLSYAVTALVPQLEPVGPHRARARLPGGRPRALLGPAVPHAAAAGRPVARGGLERDDDDLAGGREWLGLYRLNALDRRRTPTDPYRIALAVESYLRTKYTYSLTPPATDYLSPYAAFLFETKTGYCQHFAGAMAALLRFNGIPARVAVGFTTGEKVGDGTYVVTRNDAHAWVEAYFPGVGWVPFDPTPGRTLPVAGDAPTSGPERGDRRPERARRLAHGDARRRGRSARPRQEPRRRRRRRRRHGAGREAPAGRRGRRRWRSSSSAGRRAARCCAGAASTAAAGKRASALPWRSSTPS